MTMAKTSALKALKIHLQCYLRRGQLRGIIAAGRVKRIVTMRTSN